MGTNLGGSGSDLSEALDAVTERAFQRFMEDRGYGAPPAVVLVEFVDGELVHTPIALSDFYETEHEAGQPSSSVND
jgi:hypothetical protein